MTPLEDSHRCSTSPGLRHDPDATSVPCFGRPDAPGGRTEQRPNRATVQCFFKGRLFECCCLFVNYVYRYLCDLCVQKSLLASNYFRGNQESIKCFMLFLFRIVVFCSIPK